GAQAETRTLQAKILVVLHRIVGVGLALGAYAHHLLAVLHVHARRNVGVVQVHDGPARAVQSLPQLRLGVGHALDAAKAFQVGRFHVVDQRDVRLGQAGGIGDFAGGVGAHLDHGKAVFGSDPQQGERHADVV